MNELERTALNEVVRTVGIILEKVENIERVLEPQTEIREEILSALSSGKGIVDYGIGSNLGPLGKRVLNEDEEKALGFLED